jgi:hypothetical protein
MRTFNDNAGRTWTIAINVAAIKRVRGLLNVDLYKGRNLWARLNLDNPNATAVQIARAELSTICRAVGVLAPNDSVELHDLPLVIQVKYVKRAVTGELTNEIKGYGKKDTPAPATAAQPSANNTPPWRRS